MNDLPVSMMGESQEVIDRYRDMIAGGMAVGMATILSSRKCPSLDTDTSHYAGLKPLEETCGFEYAKKTKAQARAAGINISDNVHYNATIADHRGGGDPKAWIHASDGRAHVKNVINNHGSSCESLGVKENGKLLERFAKREKFVNKKLARKAEVKAERERLVAKG